MSRNRCETVCACGLDFRRRPELGRKGPPDLFDGPSYLKQIGWEDCPYKPMGYEGIPTMFGKVVCPICRLEYLGWFRSPQFPQWDGFDWEIYDTSYWSTYNDEPGDADERNWRDPVEVLKSLL